MVFGWVLCGIGVVLLVWPHGLVWIAHQYRLGMPETSSRTMSAARLGALVVAVVGLVIGLTA